MFTGFPSENTPSIQIWDCTQSVASAGSRSINLTDDCAPIQYFRTGGNTTQINVYLPSAPPEGRIIKVINHRYGASNQQVAVYYPDTGTTGAVQYFALGVGQTIDFCFSKTAYGYGPSNGYQRTGWMMLTQAGSSSAGYYGVSFSDGSHASGVQSMALGGTSSTASGQAAIVAGGFNNTASSTQSGVFAGASNTASTSNYAVVIGGNSNTANNTNAAVLGGSGVTASGFASVVLGGSSNASNANSSVVVGGQSGTARSIDSYKALPSDNPVGGSGFTQGGVLVLGKQTTDATVTTLTSFVGAASTTNQLVLPNNAAYYVRGSVIANVTGGGNTKAWSFEAAIKRGANAASTTLMQNSLNVVASDTGAAGWAVTLAADTTNGAFQVQVTGQAATTISWTCRLDSTEVTF